MLDDPRRMQAKALPMTEVIDRLGLSGLRASGCEMIGPCPMCGGRDRFGINLRSHAFLCRKCDLRGGDQIALAEQVLGIDFRAALTWLCGAAPAEISPQALADRRRAAARQAAEAEAFRAKARAEAQAIWRAATWSADSPVRGYLAARGIAPDRLPGLPRVLRYAPAHVYRRQVQGHLVTHTGPAMIALVQTADGRGGAVHQTWVDLSRPKGKARIVHDGEMQPVKLVRGSKKGGAIRLITPEGADTLVMGEGIETTLTAAAAAAVPGAAYWAGVDLGNMSGRMQRVQGARWSGLPDMDDAEAFVPPSWVRRLIFIQDGDSDPETTRAKLEAGLRRAMARRPGLIGQIVHPGAGIDLNDLILPEAAPNE